MSRRTGSGDALGTDLLIGLDSPEVHTSGICLCLFGGKNCSMSGCVITFTHKPVDSESESALKHYQIPPQF